MKKALLAIAGCLTIALMAAIVLGVPGAYLGKGATQWLAEPSPDGRFRVIAYRYPELHDIPETLGFGQGFVQLQEIATGKVLFQKTAEDLAAINMFRWTSNRVVVARFAEWELPR